MANDFDENGTRGAAPGGTGADPAAVDLALAGASRAKADAFLEHQTLLSDKQRALTDLQIENLRDIDEYEVSHLRWRRFSDRTRGALQILLVALGTVLVVAIAAAVWNASEADGLVVDSFSAPADFAARGIGGDVLANDLTARLRTARGIVNGYAFSSTSDVSKSGEGEVRVEIPETGISLTELWRFLRAWLGHEQHVSGSLRELPDGLLALNAQLGANEPIEVTGQANDLPALEQKLAERIFRQFDPINAVLYLMAANRNADAGKSAFAITHLPLPDPVRADAYVLWSEQAYADRNPYTAIARVEIALAIDPHLAVAHLNLSIEQHALLGHDEAALAEARATLAQRERDQPFDLRGAGFLKIWSAADRIIGKLTGDAAEAERAECGESCVPQHLDDAAVDTALRHDTRGARRWLAQSQAAGYGDPLDTNLAIYDEAVACSDWQAALSSLRDMVHANTISQEFDTGSSPAIFDATAVRPLRAEALAKTGDLVRADATIATTPGDCYLCTRMRGNVRAAERNWNAAAFWFAEAVRQAPSIPFAYFDWGAMLFAKGDLDGAIAKFDLANLKGPHFADPLEMWGEALVFQDRSDLALAKFAEADKYAPNWGRLHLKWGEALLWSGDRLAAAKQFALARTLDLSSVEKAELAKVAHV